MPQRIGPVIMSVAGDAFVEPAQIDAVLWEGATTAGDTAEIVERQSGLLLFAFRATGSQTWEGVGKSVSAPSGFRLKSISAGRVLVYLAEAG